MPDERLVVFPGHRVREFYSRPQLIEDDTRVGRLLADLGRSEVLPRAVAESASSVTQAVAYATLRAGNDIVCLRRRSPNRKELDDRWTLVFGGHVNPDERDGVQGLRRCVQRELREEFGDLRCTRLSLLGVLADPRSEVGRMHLGFVFEATVLAATVGLDRRFDNHDYSLIPGRHTFSKLNQLLDVDSDFFDPWSQIVLRAYRDGLYAPAASALKL
jgi:predicted NUDIX family phosphoesterase